MRYAIALAAIPVVVWAAWPAPDDKPVVAKAVATEGVRARRMDDNTFSLRWRAASELPPASVRANTVDGGQTLADGRTRIDTVRQPSPRITRRASLRRDVCARHGMRKVNYQRGRWQGWRCAR